MNISIFGVGKDSYSSSVSGMVDGKVIPWVSDSSSLGLPVWSAYNAGQRDTYFINGEGVLDTVFNLTPYLPDDINSFNYLYDLIISINSGSLDISEQHYKNDYLMIEKAFPNPFNSSTEIRFNIFTSSNVRLEVFNVLGKKVETLINKPMAQGYYSRIWNSKDIQSGTYFIRLSNNKNNEVQKISIIK